MNLEQLKTLAKNAVRASHSPKLEFSYEGEVLTASALDSALRSEINSICGDYYSYKENQNTLFALISETIDELLPERIRNTYSMFAETKTFAQGDKPVFTMKAGKARGRQFVTRVALAGVYETFKLDHTSFEVSTTAYGGAAEIGIEEFLDGRLDFAELTEIIMMGLEDAVYAEITKAMVGIVDSLQPQNTEIEASFTQATFDKLLNRARVDGEVTILTSFEIASKLVPANEWISDLDKEEMRNSGHVGKYKGATVVVLDQYYANLEKTQLGVDPSFAWLIPSGAMNEKPVKVAFEGPTLTREQENSDWSRELQTYKKFGVNLIHTNQIFAYRDEELAQD